MKSYYEIACDDFKFTQAGFNTKFYNNIVLGCEQAVEKLLKSITEEVSADVEKYLKMNNLRSIYIDLIDSGVNLDINIAGLTQLRDYYFTVRYPGETFIEVTREQCVKCIDMTYTIFDAVNKYRKDKGYNIIEIEKISLS